MIYIDNNRTVDSIQQVHRVISLIFSLVCIILIVYRYSLNSKTKNIGYLLKLRNNLFDETTAYIYLVLEIIIHLIQPYPGIQFDWVVKTLGIDVTYNINAILNSIIVIRMYVYMRISKFFNMFYGEDIKAFNHFEISSIYMFLYRSNIRYRPFVTIFVIFLFFFLIWSIMLISYERFENNGIFKFTWNVFWLIAVTVTTSNIFIILVGYGDITPNTLMGRLITVFICLLGVFMISILISAFAVYSFLNEWEYRAYQDISKLYVDKEHDYIDDFLKQKIQKFGVNKIKHVIKYNISRANYRYLIMKRFNLNISQSYEKLFMVLDNKHMTFDRLKKNLKTIKPSISKLDIKGKNNLELIKYCRDNSNRVLNVMNTIINLKYMIPLDSKIKLILEFNTITNRIIQHRDWKKKFKEWYVLYYDKRIDVHVS